MVLWMMKLYAFTLITKKVRDFLRVRLGSQRSFINSFSQISGFDLVRIQALVLTHNFNK